jgi:formylglycine-generating enzyme required for sulfatase activity
MVRGGGCALLMLNLACNTTSGVAPSPASRVTPAPGGEGVSSAATAVSPEAVAKLAVATPQTSSAAVDAGSGTRPIPEDMLEVPGGQFTMGADGIGERDEQPAHKVMVASFLLDITEVTNAKYEACVQAKACKPYREDVAKSMKAGDDKRFRGPEQPVVGVSWFDAKAYCEWRGKRLPREAEWERAARGDGRQYPWGDEAPDSKRHGCFSGCGGGTTMPVGSFPEAKGPYGHLDLAGNVWEWVEDLYDPIAYTRPNASRGEPGSCERILETLDSLRKNKQQGFTGSNPIPTECERVLRGGAFNYASPGLRVTNRVHHPGGWRILVAGFRCAKDVS